MKVITMDTNMGSRYHLVDENGHKIDEVDRYLKYLDVCGKSPNTLRSYAYHLKLFYEYINLAGINAKDIFNSTEVKPIDTLCDFMLWLQYPNTHRGVYCVNKEKCARSNSTVNTIVGTVLSLYQYLAANNEMDEVSVYRIQRNAIRYNGFLSELMKHNVESKKSLLRKPVHKTEINTITRDQYIQLLKLCSCRRDKLLLAVMFEGGLRLSEALGIHLCDLGNIEDGIVKIVPRDNNENNARVKNYAGGIIKIPQYVVDLAVSYLSRDIAEYESDYLFLTLNGKNKGLPMKADTVEKLFNRLSKDVGYKVHPHMLRHGFATEKLESGWQMVDIQAYLRHKNISSTQIYATYSDELKKEKMRVFFNQNDKIMRAISDGIT